MKFQHLKVGNIPKTTHGHCSIRLIRTYGSQRTNMYLYWDGVYFNEITLLLVT